MTYFLGIIKLLLSIDHLLNKKNKGAFLANASSLLLCFALNFIMQHIIWKKNMCCPFLFHKDGLCNWSGEHAAKSRKAMLPWPGCLVGWSVILHTKSFNFQSEHISRLQVQSPAEVCRGGNQLMFLYHVDVSRHLFLSSLSKINKKKTILRWGYKKTKKERLCQEIWDLCRNKGKLWKDCKW